MIRPRFPLTVALILTSLIFFGRVEAADLILAKDSEAEAVIVLSERPCSILDEAARKAVAPKTRDRVAFLRRGLDYTKVHASAYHLLAEFDDGGRKMTPEFKMRVQAKLNRNWALSREILLTDFKAVHVSRVAWGGWGNFNRLGWKERAARIISNRPFE